MVAELNALVELEAEQGIGNVDMPPIPTCRRPTASALTCVPAHIRGGHPLLILNISCYEK
jgi:hypothetical protein